MEPEAVELCRENARRNSTANKLWEALRLFHPTCITCMIIPFLLV